MHKPGGGDARAGAIAEAIVQLGMSVANADGVVHVDEEALVRADARRRLQKLPMQERSRLESGIALLRGTRIDATAVAARLRDALDRGERRRLMEHLFDIAVADGLLHPEEQKLLARLHGELGLDPSYFEALLRLYSAGGSGPMIVSTPEGEPSVLRQAAVAPVSAQQGDAAQNSVPVDRADDIDAIIALLSGR